MEESAKRIEGVRKTNRRKITCAHRAFPLNKKFASFANSLEDKSQMNIDVVFTRMDTGQGTFFSIIITIIIPLNVLPRRQCCWQVYSAPDLG